MDWNRIEGNWKQLKGKVQEKWGKLTDDDLDVVAGRREQLIGKLQQRYGIAKEEAEQQIAEWSNRAEEAWWKAKERV
ncbi:MAG: CsbD family protein [Piscinibacter sp.]|nr:CsbD family protein [Piscinibacter sp.]